MPPPRPEVRGFGSLAWDSRIRDLPFTFRHWMTHTAHNPLEAPGYLGGSGGAASCGREGVLGSLLRGL